PVCRISSAVLSTAQPPLQTIDMTKLFSPQRDVKQAAAARIATEPFYSWPLTRVLATWNAASSRAAASACMISVTWL
ncbi:MAG TPA: hypothetical protein VK281_09320, partial [Xanthobacteraceae bacterium]|nr:hypothetical protein [Xanthobacteraceae bacterium]